MMRHSCSLMKGFFQNHNDTGSIPLLELYQMDVGEISSNEDLYEKVYIHDITKQFLLWKEKNIRIPPDEIRSQNSGKFCENKEKVLGFK